MPTKLKIGETCSENKQCMNNNCVNNRCTRKTVAKGKPEPIEQPVEPIAPIAPIAAIPVPIKENNLPMNLKLGESCDENKQCKNNNCVNNRCTRKKPAKQKNLSKTKSKSRSISKKSSEGSPVKKTKSPSPLIPTPKYHPEDWTQHQSKRYNRPFWVNRKTGEKSWYKPYNCNWFEHYSKTRKQPYWIHNKTGYSSWTAPSKTNTAIIIPFRDDVEKLRSKQLEQFISYMTEFLKDKGCYHIFVIEQSNDERKFNRGKLLNIGFKIAIESQQFTHFIFHDVDLLPSKELLSYYVEPRENIVHMAKVWKRYDSNHYFGGVVSFPRKEYEKINGFPNNFWGWGGEDDELYKRVKQENLKIEAPSSGYYTDLENKNLEQKLKYLRENKALKCLNKTELLKQYRVPVMENGLSTVQYREIKQTSRKKNNTTIVVVDVLQNNHWSDNVCGIDNVLYGVHKK
jgi:hypothetical protein